MVYFTEKKFSSFHALSFMLLLLKVGGVKDVRKRCHMVQGTSQDLAEFEQCSLSMAIVVVMWVQF